MKHVADKRCTENQNTRFISINYFEYRHVYVLKRKKYSRAGQATDDNTAQAYCMLDNHGYRHTLRIMKYLLQFHCKNGYTNAS